MKAIVLVCGMGLSLTAGFQVKEMAQPSNLPDSPRMLSSSQRVHFNIPMFGTLGRTLCDASGDMIFDVGSALNDKGPFLRIQADGRSHIIYSLPTEFSGWGRIVPAVTPGGTLFVLFEDFQKYKLIRFKSNGTVDGVSDLEIPSAVDVQYLAVADSEISFVRGYFASKDRTNTKRPGFAAFFEPSGRLSHDLSSTAPQFDTSPRQVGPVDGDAIAGEDGKFYVLDEKEVRVLNQAGQTEKSLPFQKPSSDAHAVQVDFSSGRISIVFHTLYRTSDRELNRVGVRAILLNAQTGDKQGDFVFAPNLSNTVLCFNLQNGYTLAAESEGMAAMDVVPIR